MYNKVLYNKVIFQIINIFLFQVLRTIIMFLIIFWFLHVRVICNVIIVITVKNINNKDTKMYEFIKL